MDLCARSQRFGACMPKMSSKRAIVQSCKRAIVQSSPTSSKAPACTLRRHDAPLTGHRFQSCIPKVLKVLSNATRSSSQSNRRVAMQLSLQRSLHAEDA